MKILVFRSGAFGDLVILTPVLRHLHKQGNELTVVTSTRGMEVLKNNPNIKKLVQHKEDTPINDLSEHLEWLRKKMGCEKVLDFSESIEVSLSQHPRSPNYKLSKLERLARFNRNFYEYSFEHIGEKWEGVDLTPELFFEERESYQIRDLGTRRCEELLKKDCFNVLIGMSGSGGNKAWPWTQDLAEKICEEYPDVHIITVGDEKCRLIEPEIEGRITNLSGRIPMRMAMQFTGLVDLVIAPDTGIIHAAGCYPTKKICLLGHNTRESITKYFRNDYSIEADPILSPCSPCLFLVYDMKFQCPLDVTGGSLCMSKGIPMMKVYERFKEVYDSQSKKGS